MLIVSPPVGAGDAERNRAALLNEEEIGIESYSRVRHNNHRLLYSAVTYATFVLAQLFTGISFIEAGYWRVCIAIVLCVIAPWLYGGLTSAISKDWMGAGANLCGLGPFYQSYQEKDYPVQSKTSQEYQLISIPLCHLPLCLLYTSLLTYQASSAMAVYQTASRNLGEVRGDHPHTIFAYTYKTNDLLPGYVNYLMAAGCLLSLWSMAVSLENHLHADAAMNFTTDASFRRLKKNALFHTYTRAIRAYHFTDLALMIVCIVLVSAFPQFVPLNSISVIMTQTLSLGLALTLNARLSLTGCLGVLLVGAMPVLVSDAERVLSDHRQENLTCFLLCVRTCQYLAILTFSVTAATAARDLAATSPLSKAGYPIQGIDLTDVDTRVSITTLVGVVLLVAVTFFCVCCIYLKPRYDRLNLALRESLSTIAAPLTPTRSPQRVGTNP